MLHIIHSWNKWQLLQYGISVQMVDPLTKIMLPKDEQYPIGCWIRQKRVCTICGKIQIREQEI